MSFAHTPGSTDAGRALLFAGLRVVGLFALATMGLLGGEGLAPGFVARGRVACAARPLVTWARLPVAERFAALATGFAALAEGFVALARAGAEYGVDAATAFAPNTATIASPAGVSIACLGWRSISVTPR